MGLKGIKNFRIRGGERRARSINRLWRGRSRSRIAEETITDIHRVWSSPFQFRG